MTHRLSYYRWAVQHPQAEVAFLARTFEHYFHRPATLLRDDFCGGAGIAMAWAAMSQDHRALAVDKHPPTCRWAMREAMRVLAERAEDVVVVCADVGDARPPTVPRVEVTAAMNFGVLVYQTPATLVNYFRAARQSLKKNGLLVMDVYGGPGAMRPGVQSRAVTPPPASGVLPFTYHWEQVSVDHLTHRVRNAIHFEQRDGTWLRRAFTYDWRLWTLPELVEAMHAAGFDKAEVWCDTLDPATGQSDGRYRPIRSLPAREDWVAYVVGVKGT